MNREVLLKKAQACLLEYVKSKGLSIESIRKKKTELNRFYDYLSKVDKDLREIKARDIENYFFYLKTHGFSGSTKASAKACLTDLFLALEMNELILSDPMALTEIVIREQSGVKVILSEKEMAHFLDSIETVTGYGVRDRSIFELMYGTGMRVGEVSKLNVEDVDFSANEIMIKQSKGRKDRIVPLGLVAKSYLEKWVKTYRSFFLKELTKDQEAFFLSDRNQRLNTHSIGHRLKHYLEHCGITKEGVTPHSFRHSCATHLLQNGADIIFVAELLGHESLMTTQVYTTHIVDGLKKTHRMYHPRENELYVEP